MLNFDPEKQYGICSTPFNKTIISELQKQGINLKIFPGVEIIKCDLDATSKKYLKQLDEFDWIIFPDVYAVDFFVETLQAEGIDLFDLDLIRICAYGEAVSDRLRFSQIHADLIPAKTNTETIIKTFENYLSEGFDNLKVLIIQNSEVTSELAKRGVEINRIEVYQTQLPTSGETAILKALLNGGAIDLFLFSGAEEIANLKLLFPEVSLAKLLFEAEIIALDAAAYQSLRENGLQPKFSKM